MGLVFLGSAILFGRLYLMYKNTMGFVKGIAAGAAVGVAAVVIGGKAMENNRQLRKTAHKAAQAVNGFVDEVGSAIRG